MKSWISRAVLAVGAAVALIAGGVGVANAGPTVMGDTTVLLTDIDGNNVGYMKHLDDPDTFKVCDRQNDGHGVTGKLYLYQAGWQLRETESDGEDAGCDYFDYNVVPYVAKYLMKVCWNGPGEICAKDEFTED